MTPKKKKSAPMRRQHPAKVLSEGEVLLPAVADDVIDEVYTQIRGLVHEATVALAVKVGEVLVQRFFGGDIEKARSQGPKDSSLRALAKRFEADGIPGSSVSALSRAIGTYALNQRTGVATKQQLTVSHVHAILGISDPNKQDALLTEAHEKGWSVAKLRERAAAIRREGADGRGRPTLPAWEKTAKMLRRLAFDDRKFEHLSELSKLKEKDAREALEGVVKMRERLAAIETALEGRLGSTAKVGGAA